MPAMPRQARWWIATMPAAAWDISSAEDLPQFIKYIKGQREVGENTGFEHYQFVIQCHRPTRLSQLKKWSPVSHFEPTRSEAALDYVWKEQTRVPDTQFEYGQRGLARNTKHDWDIIKSNAKLGKFEDIPSDVYIRYYGTLKRIALDHLQPVLLFNLGCL